MGKKSLFLLALLLAFCALVAAVNGFVNQQHEGGETQPGGQGEGESPGENGRFLLKESVQMVQTDAGEMRVLKASGQRFWRSPMQLGFITMEPNSLFIPQYLDANLILFIRRGGATVGHIYKDDLVERTLKTGDVYVIEAGSVFYIVNRAEGQRLQIICSIDTSQNYGWQWSTQGFQTYFIGGGANPASVLNGFYPSTLAAALNISEGEVREILSSRHLGSIIHLSGSLATSPWSKFLDLKDHQKLAHLKRIVHVEEDDKEEEKQQTWSFRKLWPSILGDRNKKGGDRRGRGPDAYNMFDRKPDFSNSYGWTKAVTESDYSPLGLLNIGLYLVHLTAGSMLAPHTNPKAIEFGVVTSGIGDIEIVFPNGTLAMKARVTVGDAFWVPKFFPFCQIASRTGPFEFFGFTTSSKYNNPQFFVGYNSLLQKLLGPELAASLGIREDMLRRIAYAQNQSTVLPAAAIAPGDGKLDTEKTQKLVADAIRSFGNGMMMGFD